MNVSDLNKEQLQIKNVWSQIPPTGSSIQPSLVGSLLAPQLGNTFVDLDWIPLIPQNISSLLLHKTHLFPSIANLVNSALQSVPQITLKDHPNTIVSIPKPDTHPAPLTSFILTKLTMPPHLSSNHTPSRQSSHLPAPSSGPRTRHSIAASLTTPSSKKNAVSLKSPGTQAPASPSVKTESRPLSITQAGTVSDNSSFLRNGTGNISPLSSSPSPTPVRKKSKTSRLNKESVGNSVIHDDLIAFIDSVTSKGASTRAIPVSFLTYAMDSISTGSLKLTKDTSQKLVASCMPHIEACKNQTLLRPHINNPAAFTEMDSCDDEDDEPRSQSKKLLLVLQNVEAGMIAAHVAMLLYLAHSEIVVADYALSVADAFKNQVQETVLPVLESSDNCGLPMKSLSSPSRKSQSNGNSRRKSVGPQTAKIQNAIESQAGVLKIPTSVLNADIHKKVYQIMCLQIALMPRLQAFVMHHANVSALEPFAISVCYGATAPLYATVTVVNDAMRARSMELVTTIASSMPSLRIGILEDTVGNLLNSTSSSSSTSKRLDKLYRLEDGTAILVSTALILNLIQALLSSDSNLSAAVSSKTYAAKFRECTALAIHVVKYLLSRATKKSKATATNESEYLVLLRSVFEDVVTVLPSPEFPAAELMARITLQLMIGVMEDESSGSGVGDIGIKTLAMDVFSSLLCHSKRMTTFHPNATDTEVQTAREKVGAYLQQQGKNNLALRSAHLYYLGEWQMFNETLQGNITDSSEPQIANGDVLNNTSDVKPDNTDSRSDHKKFDANTAVTRTDVQFALNVLFTRVSSLPRLIEPVLIRVVQWFDAKEANIRSRAIKVLSSVAQVDPSLMDLPYIQTAIQARLRDASPSVRDSVLDVVGKWIIANAESGKGVNPSYLSVLLDRSMDKSTSVRKRAIKTLGVLADYVNVTDQIEIAMRLFMRVTDEEDTVIDVAKRVFLNLAFPLTTTVHALNCGDGTNDSKASREAPAVRSSMHLFNSLSTQERLKALSQATVFAHLVPRVQREEFVSFLRKYASMRLGNLPPALLYQIQSSELFSLTQFDALRALGILAQAVPKVVTAEMLTHCAQLLPKSMDKLQKPSEGELRLASLTLGFFRDSFYACDPGLSPIAAAGLLNPVLLPTQVLEDLETNALRIVQGGFLELVSDAVSVSCLAARRLERPTNGNLVQLLSSVTTFLTKTRKSLTAADSASNGVESAKSSQDVSLVHVNRLLIIIGSFAQHGGLHLVDSPPEPVFALLLFFATPSRLLNETIRATALRAFGQMSLQYGKCLLLPGVLQIIKNALASCDTELLVAEAALDLIVRFMAQEDSHAAEKFAAAELEDFDRQAFLGTSLDTLNAGIAESLAQSCVRDLLKCSLLIPSRTTQRLIELAQEAIKCITQHRLTHPKLVMPAVMALQTSPELKIAAKARSCHIKLNSQHRSTIYDANRESVVMAFDYQSRLQGTPSPVGFAMENLSAGTASAHLTPFYTIIRDNKRDRKSFLGVLMRFFEFKVHHEDQSRQRLSTNANDLYVPMASNIGRCKWLVENLATLEYRHEDEVLIVLNYANGLISSIGLAIKGDLERATSAFDSGNLPGGAPGTSQSPLTGFETGWDTESLVIGAVIIIMLVSMKSYLIEVYNISTSKLQTLNGNPDGRSAAIRVLHRKDDVPMYSSSLHEDEIAAMLSNDKTRVCVLAPSIHAKLDELLDDSPELMNDLSEGSSNDSSDASHVQSRSNTSKPIILLPVKRKSSSSTPKKRRKIL